MKGIHNLYFKFNYEFTNGPSKNFIKLSHEFRKSNTNLCTEILFKTGFKSKSVPRLSKLF